MTTELQKPGANKCTIRDWLEGDTLKNQIATALPRHITPDRWLRAMMTAVQKSPRLLECTQASLFQSFMRLSQTGLEADGYYAHLIPFWNNKGQRYECQLFIDYKGLIRLIRNSPDIEDIYAEVVYENDTFEVELGTNKKIVHKPLVKGDRGPILGVYSVAVIRNSPTRSFDWMSVDDVEKIRARSRSSKEGPWVTDYAEMARKTVVRRHSKYLPLAAEVLTQINNAEDEPIDVTPPAESSAVKKVVAAESLFADPLQPATPKEQPPRQFFNVGGIPDEQEKKPEAPAQPPAQPSAKATKPEPAVKPEAAQPEIFPDTAAVSEPPPRSTAPEVKAEPLPKQPRMTKGRLIVLIDAQLEKDGMTQEMLAKWAVEKKMLPEGAEGIHEMETEQLRQICDGWPVVRDSIKALLSEGQRKDPEVF